MGSRRFELCRRQPVRRRPDRLLSRVDEAARRCRTRDLVNRYAVAMRCVGDGRAGRKCSI